jgi:4'-phosphopantetheinyl transferase EntD
MTLHVPAPGWLGTRRWPQRVGASQCSVAAIHFAPEQFERNAFTRYDVDMPPSIARSVPKRQAEFFFGRLAARQALHEAGWSGQVGIGPLRAPSFPPGVVGSITHTGGWAAAAVLPVPACRGLGIDLEVPVDETLLASLDSEIWDTNEGRVLRACPGLPMTVLGTLLFSAKESFYKALSAAAGRVFDFSAARLQSIDLPAGRMVLQTTETLAEGWPAGTRCTVDFTLLPEGLVMTAFAW